MVSGLYSACGRGRCKLGCDSVATSSCCAGIAQAALSYSKVFVLDNLGDLYQLTAAGTVVAGACRSGWLMHHV